MFWLLTPAFSSVLPTLLLLQLPPKKAAVTTAVTIGEFILWLMTSVKTTSGIKSDYNAPKYSHDVAILSTLLFARTRSTDSPRSSYYCLTQ